MDSDRSKIVHMIPALRDRGIESGKREIIDNSGGVGVAFVAGKESKKEDF